MGAHVKHMGFELELAAQQIVYALAYVPENRRIIVIQHLAPKKLQAVVREMVETA